MTAPHTVLLEHPTAQRLADLAGIEHDLELTIRACDLFLGSPSYGSEEAILRSKATATFAIITYFRTLSSGVRSGVTTAQILQLDPELQTIHARLKTTRDQYLAHSINCQEVNSVQLVFKPDGGLDKIGTMHSRPATFSVEEMMALKRLAEALRQIISDEYDVELDLVWNFVESLPEDERQKAFRLTSTSYPQLSAVKRRRFRG